MSRRLMMVFFLLAGPAGQVFAQLDTAVVSKIREEGLHRSRVMEMISFMTDVYGPRLTWSPEYRQAANWASSKLKEWGLKNVHDDYFSPVGKGWTLKRFSANVLSPRAFPLIAYPKAWSPSTKGIVRGPVIHLKAGTEEELQKYKGKLKNAFVMLSGLRHVEARWSAQATRMDDSSLLTLANAGEATEGPRFFRDSASVRRFVESMRFNVERTEFCMREGAAAFLDAGRGEGGTIFVQQAAVPVVPRSLSDVFSPKTNAYDPKSLAILPQISLTGEHYNRLVRMIEKGESPQMEMNLEVEWTKADSGFSVIAEIPGTDLSDEIVMIGAHFDSWQASTGATDNAAGSAVCMEAVRILQTLGLKPRRTIRIALWGGEEQGLFGSRSYVAKHFGTVEGDQVEILLRGEGGGEIRKKAGYEKFSVYFNLDNGTGKVRGVYLQGNEAVKPIFREWLAAVNDPTAQTLTLSPTGQTDHMPFEVIGLPGFQFIQDPIEYRTRTHHSNMDYYERVQEHDVKQASIVMAVFAYAAAMREDLLPRKGAAVKQTGDAASGGN